MQSIGWAQPVIPGPAHAPRCYRLMTGGSADDPDMNPAGSHLTA